MECSPWREGTNILDMQRIRIQTTISLTEMRSEHILEVNKVKGQLFLSFKDVIEIKRDITFIMLDLHKIILTPEFSRTHYLVIAV